MRCTVRKSLAAAGAAVLLGASVGVSVASATSGTLVLAQSTVLDADHFGNIVIASDGVTLDCAGHTIHGPGLATYGGGIDIESANGVTVSRCVVTGFVNSGIFGRDGTGLRLEGNTLAANGGDGIHLDAVASSTVAGNSSRSNGATDPTGSGIVVTASTGVTIARNLASDNASDGVHLWRTTGATLADNTASANAVAGLLLEESDGNEVTGNVANQDWAGIVLDLAHGNAVRANTANRNTSWGFSVQRGSGPNELTANTANRNGNGFRVRESGGIVLAGNTANANEVYGFFLLENGGLNVLTGNTALNNHGYDAWEDTPEGVMSTWLANRFRTTWHWPSP